MVQLYPSAVQFHCGGVTYLAVLLAGGTAWAGEWWMAGGLFAVAVAGAIASSFMSTRAG